MKYIGQFHDGMHISDVYLCKKKQIALTKNGKEYGALTLQDKTGTVDAKIWDLGSPGVGNFETLDYVYIDGDITVFQGANQVNVRRIRRADEGEYTESDYLPVSSRDVKAMYQELRALIESMKNPYLKKLASSYYVEDSDFVRRFCFHSAAKSVHHGFVGGLLEHTLSILKMCEYYVSAYEILNKDLLYTAAIFHDIGKTKELSTFPENDYTDDGQLLGHIVIGVEMIGEGVRTIEGFPEKLASELKHCVIAHHGELEYGSPKKPALAEAVALNLADNADAKMQTLTEIFKGKTGTDWLGFNRLFDSNLRRTSGA